MKFIKPIILAFSMFSRIPMPSADWGGGGMRYMMCAFPLVGAVIGLLVWGYGALCIAAGLGAFLRGAGLAAIPIAVTGGIHLDGLCDVADALAGGTDAARRREILKDPHTGAFGVIWCVCYMMLYFAMSAQLVLEAGRMAVLCLGFVLSRALSALAVLSFPQSSGEGLAATFKSGADAARASAVLCVTLAAACAAMLLVSPIRGAAAI
ncbi:MAG: adenosylcobinamide-GDP ribazoletransferase, partial [Oscillospiraceae bacterium]|nr:adenosylcobinamide-GDP ribazoletransferase [Oscillospiraceae bacterium]